MLRKGKVVPVSLVAPFVLLLSDTNIVLYGNRSLCCKTFVSKHKLFSLEITTNVIWIRKPLSFSTKFPKTIMFLKVHINIIQKGFRPLINGIIVFESKRHDKWIFKYDHIHLYYNIIFYSILIEGKLPI